METSGSPEFRLAVECCRHSFREPPPHDDPVPNQLGWNRFLRLVRFHRIEGLVWNALAGQARLPDAVAGALQQAASAIAAANLHAKADCQRLLLRFEATKVPILFLKGLTLSALAYGDPAIKAAIDIDLLIDPRDVNQATELLLESGCKLICPRDEGRLEAWHRTWKESLWRKEGSALEIDLHTRAANNPRVIPTITVHSSSRSVDIGDGISLPTLADDELFAYLAVHGASSAWFRLKWISDFAALLQAKPPPEIERLYRRSQQLRAGRAAGQALLLADDLFKSLDRLPSLRRELADDRMTRLLFKAARRQLGSNLVEPTEQGFGTLTIHWTQFLLLPGLSYKGSEFAGQVGRMLSRS